MVGTMLDVTSDGDARGHAMRAFRRAVSGELRLNGV
jgi:hypothetical protein